MTANNNAVETASRKNLHGFLNANLTPVALCIVAKYEEQGISISLDKAKILARPKIIDEWNQAAKSMLSKHRYFQAAAVALTIVPLGLGVGAVLSGFAIIAPLAAVGVLGGLKNLVMVSSNTKHLKKQIYKQEDSITADAEEYWAIYMKAQNRVVDKFTSIELVPTYHKPLNKVSSPAL